MGKLTPVFVGAIFIIFLLFMAIYLRKAWGALRTLQAERQRIGELPRNIIDAHQYIDDFRAISDDCREFSKILIVDSNKVYATQDIESKVEEIWSPVILQSRMFPTVAAILTGLGVLGTFVGLLIGLNGLSLKGDMDQLQGEIQRMANGAAIAFVTSICGVFLSLIFTTVEKLFSDKIAGEFRGLQRELAHKFQPVPIMQVFVKMLGESKNTNNILGGLAAQIGNNMQTIFDNFLVNIIQELTQAINKAIGQISEAISTSIDQKLGEAIKNLDVSIKKMIEIFEKMQKTQTDGIITALNKTIEDFINQLKEMGNAPREGIDEAAGKLQTALGSIVNPLQQLSGSMSKFIGNIEERQKDTDNLHDTIKGDFGELIKQIECASDMLSSSSEELRHSTNNLKEFGSTIVDSSKVVKDSADIVSNISKHQSEATDNLSGIITNIANISEAFKTLHNDFNGLIEKLENLGPGISAPVVGAAGGLGEKLNSLTEIIGNMSESINDFIDKQGIATEDINNLMKSIEDASRKMQSSSTELKEFGSTITESTGIVKDAAVSVKDISEKQGEYIIELNKTFEYINNVRISLDKARKGFEEVSNSLSQSVTTSSDAFNNLTEHYDGIHDKLTNHMEALDKHMADILKHFVDTAKAHINDFITNWDKKTKPVFSNLQQLAEEMEGIIDELEEKPNKK